MEIALRCPWAWGQNAGRLTSGAKARLIAGALIRSAEALRQPQKHSPKNRKTRHRKTSPPASSGDAVAATQKTFCILPRITLMKPLTVGRLCKELMRGKQKKFVGGGPKFSGVV